MKIKLKYQGVSADRYCREPQERAFAEAWQKANENQRLLANIMSPGSSFSFMPRDLSAYDHKLAASVIQWLGSTVGQHWLAELGFVKQKPAPVPVVPAKPKKKLDLPTRVVMQVRGYTSPKQVAKSDREKVKLLNFGLAYGVEPDEVEEQRSFEDLCQVFAAWVKTLR